MMSQSNEKDLSNNLNIHVRRKCGYKIQHVKVQEL